MRLSSPLKAVATADSTATSRFKGQTLCHRPTDSIQYCSISFLLLFISYILLLCPEELVCAQACIRGESARCTPRSTIRRRTGDLVLSTRVSCLYVHLAMNFIRRLDGFSTVPSVGLDLTPWRCAPLAALLRFPFISPCPSPY